MIDPAFSTDFAGLCAIYLSFLILGYAETHFRFAGLPSFLFKKEPEIIFDLPFRAKIGETIPLFLFTKDAHEYPVKLLQMTTHISAQKRSYRKLISEKLDQPVSEKYFSRTFELAADMFPTAGFYELDVELTYELNGKIKSLRQDNYRSIPHEPFEIYLSNEALPMLEGWHWGDLHVHSNFTEDQVEFGAPIAETIRCAKSVGLGFLAVTDHSFDFDTADSDAIPDQEFSSPKWETFISEIQRLQAANRDFVLLPGEEVSTGNDRNQNIHCLLIGNREFYPGSGDGAKILFKNEPTLPLPELLSRIRMKENHTVIAAAHPGDIPPRSQKFILNRGYWNDADLLNERMDYWQILNGKLDRFFLSSIEKWKQALLNRRPIGILAGTDAHGNFNCFRQIKTPLLKMVKHRYQLLGLTRTGVFIQGKPNHGNLLDALRKKRVVISNGPIIYMEVVRDGHIFRIGDEVSLDPTVMIKLQAKSSEEFGELHNIYLYNGSYQDQKEHRLAVEVPDRTYAFEERIDLFGRIKSGYIRAEVYTDNGLANFFCLTNPIWVR